MDNKNNIIPSAKQLRTILIILWSFLGVYLIIKLLGGNWFEIVCKNERFINICAYIDNHFILKYIVATIVSLILHYFLYLAILRQWVFTTKQFICFIIFIPIQNLIKVTFMDIVWVSILLTIIDELLFPCILYIIEGNKITTKFLLVNVLISSIFDMAFQVISALVKNLGVKLIDDSSLITLIYGIDVFIMMALYYLYCNKINMERNK